MLREAVCKKPICRMQVNKEEIDTAGLDYATNEKIIRSIGRRCGVKQEPVKVGPKVGRNDLVLVAWQKI